MGVKLGDEVRGYTRFRFLSELLVAEGFEVDLVTSSFQHWDKAQRDCSRACYRDLPYQVRFIHEPGYKRNLDLARIRSHRIAAKGVRAFFAERFAEDPRAYDLVADINDLWPEAMRMALDVPLLSDIAFAPFARDAARVYELLDAAVGTSDEYAARPSADRQRPYQRLTVYVGNDLAACAQRHEGAVAKPAGELWVAYAGTLGASYDLATLIEAARLLQERDLPQLRVKVLGDGPDREQLQSLAERLGAPADFLGYTPYDQMAAWLHRSDILVNSLVRTAPQSIVTKIGDYLAAGKPMINTGSSPEFRAKVEADGFGLNVPAEDPKALADALEELVHNPSRRKMMGAKARAVAEEQFDQPRSYQAIVDLIRSLTDQHPTSPDPIPGSEQHHG